MPAPRDPTNKGTKRRVRNAGFSRQSGKAAKSRWVCDTIAGTAKYAESRVCCLFLFYCHVCVCVCVCAGARRHKKKFNELSRSPNQNNRSGPTLWSQHHVSAFLCWKKPDAATPAAAVTCTKRTATKEQKSKIESTWGQESRAEQEQRARTHIAASRSRSKNSPSLCWLWRWCVYGKVAE